MKHPLRTFRPSHDGMEGKKCVRSSRFEGKEESSVKLQCTTTETNPREWWVRTMSLLRPRGEYARNPLIVDSGMSVDSRVGISSRKTRLSCIFLLTASPAFFKDRSAYHDKSHLILWCPAKNDCHNLVLVNAQWHSCICSNYSLSMDSELASLAM